MSTTQEAKNILDRIQPICPEEREIWNATVFNPRDNIRDRWRAKRILDGCTLYGGDIPPILYRARYNKPYGECVNVPHMRWEINKYNKIRNLEQNLQLERKNNEALKNRVNKLETEIKALGEIIDSKFKEAKEQLQSDLSKIGSEIKMANVVLPEPDEPDTLEEPGEEEKFSLEDIKKAETLRSMLKDYLRIWKDFDKLIPRMNTQELRDRYKIRKATYLANKKLATSKSVDRAIGSISIDMNRLISAIDSIE